MNVVYLLLFVLSSTGLWAVSKDDLQGTWYRDYGVYRAWSDDNQGTISTFEEDLIFHKDDTAVIYDKSSDTYRGKSIYTILSRDGKDFIVFYSPGQNPKDTKIQDKQGYYVSIEEDKKKHDVLVFVTVSDYKKAKNKSKARSMTYTRVQDSYGKVKFMVPSNR